jgi:hypothetical protein
LKISQCKGSRKQQECEKHCTEPVCQEFPHLSENNPLVKDPVSRYGFDTKMPEDRKKLTDSMQASQAG